MDGVGIRKRSKNRVLTMSMTTTANTSASSHSRNLPFGGLPDLGDRSPFVRLLPLEGLSPLVGWLPLSLFSAPLDGFFERASRRFLRSSLFSSDLDTDKVYRVDYWIDLAPSYSGGSFEDDIYAPIRGLPNAKSGGSIRTS